MGNNDNSGNGNYGGNGPGATPEGLFEELPSDGLLTGNVQGTGIVRTPTVNPWPAWSTEQDPHKGFDRYLPIPTAADMRRRSLFGIPLRSFLTGQEVSDQTLEDYISEAISEIEHTLGLFITPVTFEERHDYSREMQFYAFGVCKVYHSPILNVEKYQLTFNNGIGIPGSLPLVDIPLEFIHVQPQDGTVQLVPAQGVTISGFIVSIYSGLGYHAFNSQAISYWPGAVFIKYRAGFERHKVPALLVSLIENLAAYRFLSSIGFLLFPYNSTSVGIDGTSQSVSTPGPLFLQARLNELEKIYTREMEAAKGYYQKRFLIDALGY
jgi:hypothetical protein